MPQTAETSRPSLSDYKAPDVSTMLMDEERREKERQEERKEGRKKGKGKFILNDLK